MKHPKEHGKGTHKEHGNEMTKHHVLKPSSSSYAIKMIDYDDKYMYSDDGLAYVHQGDTTIDQLKKCYINPNTEYMVLNKDEDMTIEIIKL